jgi:hypothetical protein
MTSKYFSGVLIIALSFVLCMPAGASQPGPGYNGPVVAPIVGALAAVAVVIIVAIHYSKKRSITGCVAAAGNGLTITDEKDKQTYALSGDTFGLKPGDRMKVKGKKAKHASSDTARAWKATGVSTNFGVCQP